MSGPVLSVVTERRNGPLIAQVARLWIMPGDRVADVTYGRGLWWTDYRPERLVPSDLATDGIDFRALPYADGSFDVIAFDPPYIAQGGRSTSTTPDMLDRYGLNDVPATAGELAVMIADGVTEAARVLAPGGRLLVKCMDYINSGHYVQGRHGVVTAALAAGLEQADEFIHASGTGPQPATNRDGSPRLQVHSRRAHSLLCVFQKPPIWRGNRKGGRA